MDLIDITYGQESEEVASLPTVAITLQNVYVFIGAACVGIARLKQEIHCPSL